MKLAAPALLILFSSHVSAAVLHVPGDYPTIQEAVDAAAPTGDEVIVAAGLYDENVVIPAKCLDLTGAGSDQTTVTSIHYAGTPEGYGGGGLDGFRVTGNLTGHHAGGYLSLEHCSVDGATALSLERLPSGVGLSFCVFKGTFDLSGDGGDDTWWQRGIALNCDFYESVSMISGLCETRLEACRFHGDAGVIAFGHRYADVIDCTFLGSGRIQAGFFSPEVNVIGNDLSGGAILTMGSVSVVSHNAGASRIEISAQGAGLATVAHNVVASGDGAGIGLLDCAEAWIDGNTVYGCLTGVSLSGFADSRYSILGNLIVGNGRGAWSYYPPDIDLIQCNDVWGNAGGNWVGMEDLTGVNGNFSQDPIFCNHEDFLLAANSPCLNGPCGQVGARGQGCDAGGACCHADGTCTITTQDACSPGVWLGVDSSCDPDPCLSGACCLHVACETYTPDECASHGGTYEGNGTVCDPNPCPTSAIEGAFSTRADLRVTPNPARGACRIVVPLSRPGLVSIAVVDAGGRVVGEILGGSFEAGDVEVEWDGRNASGQLVPAGTYFLRIPGGHAPRLVLLRE